MKQQDVDRLLVQAKGLAEHAMELHILSVRIGQGAPMEDDYRTGQRILAEAEALLTDLENLISKERR